MAEDAVGEVGTDTELSYAPATDEQRPVGAGHGQVTGASKQTASIPGGGGNGQIIPIRDSERGRELARRRWDAVSKAARLGLGDAGEQLPDVSKRQPLAVVRYLVEQHAMNAADPSQRGSTQSFKQVMELAYPKPEKDSAAATGTDGDLAELVAAWRAAKQANPELGQRAAALLRGQASE